MPEHVHILTHGDRTSAEICTIDFVDNQMGTPYN